MTEICSALILPLVLGGIPMYHSMVINCGFAFMVINALYSTVF